MTRPTRRAVFVVGAGALFALVPTLLGAGWWPLWVAFVLVSAAAAGCDALLAPVPELLRLAVRSPEQLYIGDDGLLELTVGWDPDRAGVRRRAVDVEALVDTDELLERQPSMAGRFDQAPAALVIPLRPIRRGRAQVHRVWLRWTGPLGLMERVWVVDLGREIPIVPNLPRVKAAALRFFGAHTAETGLKTERYVGGGSEFDSLRRYMPGHDTRAIDWKASARQMKLMCREYRAERNHNVVLAFDTGRLMSEPLAGVPRLDHAVTNGLALAWCCLRSGDRVGLFAFDSASRLFVAPQANARSFAQLQRQTASLDYRQEETNFTLGMLELTGRLKRRSLVVVFTDFVDAVTADLMVDNLGRLARRHLILFVAIADPLLSDLEETEPRALSDVHRAVVAADLQHDRRAVFEQLAQRGIQVLEVAPGEVSVDLVNRYLDIKRRELV